MGTLVRYCELVGSILWLLWNISLYIAYIFFNITTTWMELHIFIKNICSPVCNNFLNLSADVLHLM